MCKSFQNNIKMKIHMKNFRCYEDKIIDFGNDGVTLISGPSGKGKSTIFMAIYFALFGNGNKLQSYGKNSCYVKLEFEDMTIVRTKRPNRLVVNDIHEDAAAQSIINEKFDSFDTSGYISQNALNSFICMKPADRLIHLENIAFKDVKLDTLKGKTKSYITKCNEKLIGVTSNLNMTKQILEQMVKPEDIPFPIKCKKSQIHLAIKNENTRRQNCEIMIKKLIKKNTKLREEINNKKIYENNILHTRENLSMVKDKISLYRKDIEKIEYNGDDMLNEKKEVLKKYLLYKEYFLIKEKYESDTEYVKKLEVDELNEIANKIETIKKSLWEEYTLDEIEETIDDLTTSYSDSIRLQKLNNKLIKYEVYDVESIKNTVDKLTDKREMLIHNMKSSIHTCPNCSVKLRVSNTKISIEEDTNDNRENIDEILEDYDKQIKKYNEQLQVAKERSEIELQIKEINEKYEELPTIDEIKGDIEYLQSYKSENISKGKKLYELENEPKLSSTYYKLKKDLVKLEEKLGSFDDICSESIDEESVRSYISSQELLKNTITNIEKEISKLVVEEEKYNSSIQTLLDKYSDSDDISMLENDIITNDENIKIHREKLETHNTNIDRIKIWESNKEELDKYNEWVEKVSGLTNEESILRKEYAAALSLKETIIEAESIAMKNIVESINTHARQYLDAFFTDNPICVSLQTFKEKKGDSKPQINLSIDYKGMDADLSMLSGGELSRVVLAFTLALSEMFNTPLIMLDECTSSLDEELSGVVFDYIKDNFNGKIALIIAHQVVTGSFDRVINL